MGLITELPISNKKGWPWSEEVDPKIYDSNVNWPKISIVTPSYNQGQFIEETIRSIVLQNYPNIEYIVMDGASSDSTIDVLNVYKPWINVCVSEKDKGQSDALTKGFAIASGTFMNWINSDDILCFEGLYHIGKAILEHPEADFIHGRNGIMTIDSEIYSYMPHPNDFLDERYLCEMPYGQQACFFSKKVYQACGGINSVLRFSMDYELYLKIHLLDIKSIQIDALIGSIRIHDNTKTAQLESIMHLENGNSFLTFLESIGDYKRAKFFKNIGHVAYSKYNVKLKLSKAFVNKVFVRYLKKNIWYYYNINQFKVAKQMAILIIKTDIGNITNKDYLKIIKDGFSRRQ